MSHPGSGEESRPPRTHRPAAGRTGARAGHGASGRSAHGARAAGPHRAATGPAGPPSRGSTRPATGSQQGFRRAARGLVDVVVGTTRGTATAARGTARGLRRATHAQGAGETGLGRLIELHALNFAGDALLAVALAGTLFFQVPTGEARGRVALYLLVTIAPFALLAPVIGPLLDRVRHGRRYALAATFVLRAGLMWVMGAAVAGDQDPLKLYPAAFGALVLSRAYGIMRSTVVPRLLPPTIGLVSANGRAQLAGVIATAVAGGVGAGVAKLFGPAWVLYACVAVMVLGAVLSIRLPRTVDSAAGELPARMSAEPEPGRAGVRPRQWNVGPAVVQAVRVNAALRAYSGFLTLFLAFLLREHPVGGASTTVGVGVLIVGAAVGSGLGTGAGTLLRERRPETILVGVLVLAIVLSFVGSWLFGSVAVLALVGASAGFAQSLGKLSLDAVIQREVPEAVRTSAFARSETVLQLSWVAGGGAGLYLPVSGSVGLLVIGIVLAAALVPTLRHLRS